MEQINIKKASKNEDETNLDVYIQIWKNMKENKAMDHGIWRRLFQDNKWDFSRRD